MFGTEYKKLNIDLECKLNPYPANGEKMASS